MITFGRPKRPLSITEHKTDLFKNPKAISPPVFYACDVHSAMCLAPNNVVRKVGRFAFM